MRAETPLMNQWQFWMEDDGRKSIVDLPHDWVINSTFVNNPDDASQGFRVRMGTGIYEKQILIDKRDDHRYFLKFDGVYENSTIYINGAEAGKHAYGYSPFELEITSLLVCGNNTIKVVICHNAYPHDRWYSGAGIYRKVTLVETEQLYLDKNEIVIKTQLSDDYKNAYLKIEGINPTNTVSGELYSLSSEDGDERKQLVTKTEIVTGGALELDVHDPSLWSAEEPNLYEVVLKLWKEGQIADKVDFHIGIRKVSISPDQGLLINGEKVKLRGICLHQDCGAVGIAVRKEFMRRRLQQLKEIGVNAIRTAHHVYSSDFLDLCDELGFYVYEECFDKWTGGHYKNFFAKNWQSEVEAMVKRDRNRPSVIIWGVGNEVENQGQDSMLQILEMLVAHLKKFDKTRPVTCAMNPHFKRESNIDASKIKDIQQFVDETDDTEIFDVNEKIERIKKIAKVVDILACNYQEQWYKQIHASIPDKAILGTEVYAYFLGHPDQFKNFTENIPSFVPDKYPYVIGSMIWTGIDYLGESMGWPMKGSNSGFIRTNFERKPLSYILQSHWTKKPMIHFSVLDYSLDDEGVKDHWDTPPYVDHWDFRQFHFGVIPYMIATNCEEVELWINQQRLYLPKPSECHDGIIKGFIKWEPGTIVAIGKNNGKEVCRQVLKTPDVAVKLAFDTTENHLHFEQGYELLLTVRAKDKNGNPCFRESSTVRFRVEGPGRIVSVDNGNCKSMEPFGEPFRHLYRGQASVIVALDGTPGRIKVSADADGMMSAESVIFAE